MGDMTPPPSSTQSSNSLSPLTRAPRCPSTHFVPLFTPLPWPGARRGVTDPARMFRIKGLGFNWGLELRV